MSDISFSIGGTPAPFISAMDKVKESAKESASKVSESFGIEGVRGERSLHTTFTTAFTDLTKNGTNSAEAIGGAFESMTEGLRLNLGTMAALVAVMELVKIMYAGYEAGEKMKASMKDALSIKSDVTSQSVQQVQDSVKKLKADAEANNLAAMSSMTAGATVFIQALEEGKSISEVVREDAENYNRLKQEAHDMEDAEAAKQIDNANAVLAIKLEGHDKEAEALEHQQQMQEKLDEATEKHNQRQIASLNKEIELEAQLSERQADKAEQEREDKLDDIRSQIYDERADRGSDQDKLKWLHEKEEGAKSKFGQADAMGRDPIKIEETRLEWEKAITAEKEQQKKIDDKKLAAFQKGNETAAEQSKKQEETAKKVQEYTERRASLLKEQQEAQRDVTATALDATLFHGQTSSLAKLGLGGRVSGASYGNQAQLKAAQDAAKHLADIKANIQHLAGQIGVAR